MSTLKNHRYQIKELQDRDEQRKLQNEQSGWRKGEAEVRAGKERHDKEEVGGDEPNPGDQNALKRSHPHGPASSATTGGTVAGPLGMQQQCSRPLVVRHPMLPYCTQACLRSLCRGQAIDRKCPNADLHLSVARGSDRHALTTRDVRARVVAQLAANMDQDCESLLYDQSLGRYGVLFKITVTGFGYTFVAKAVQTVHRLILQHEVHIYTALDAFQGQLIPVCLGTIDLMRPIPRQNGRLLAHMLLMSYAGPDVCTQRVPPGVDLDREATKTCHELWTAGLADDDIHDANLSWNKEVRRIMHFDFDEAYMRSPGPLPPPPVPSPAPAASPPVKQSLNASLKDRSQTDKPARTKLSRHARPI